MEYPHLKEVWPHLHIIEGLRVALNQWGTGRCYYRRRANGKRALLARG